MQNKQTSFNINQTQSSSDILVQTQKIMPHAHTLLLSLFMSSLEIKKGFRVPSPSLKALIPNLQGGVSYWYFQFLCRIITKNPTFGLEYVLQICLGFRYFLSSEAGKRPVNDCVFDANAVNPQHVVYWFRVMCSVMHVKGAPRHKVQTNFKQFFFNQF